MSVSLALPSGLYCAIFLMPFVVSCGGETQSLNDVVSGTPFDNYSAKLSDAERVRFKQFLNQVRCGSMGCSISDMMFDSPEAITRHFSENVLHQRDKGLVASSSRVWPNSVSVCWTDDSNASYLERLGLVAAVEDTWSTYANINFDWFVAPFNVFLNSCNEDESSSYDIKIWQDSRQTRGCSRVGDDGAIGVSCKDSVEHDWATLTLGTGGGYAITAVHEFGHAIGIYHEQDREDSTCESGVNTNNPPYSEGARDVGNYDELSIMNYCAEKAGPDISTGDVASSTFLYDGRATNSITFSAISWEETDITYTVTRPGGGASAVLQTDVHNSPTDKVFGTSETGGVVSITPSTNGLRCSTRSRPPGVNGTKPPVIFDTSSSIKVDCYSTALIGTIL